VSSLVVKAEAPAERPPRPQLQPIDRDKTCPLLLRVFTRIGGRFKTEEFENPGKLPADELDMYTWKDASLKELSELVKQEIPQAKARNARLGFSLAYPDKRGRFLLREVGMTFNGRRHPDEAKTLDGARFEIGDYLTVEIFPDEGPRGRAPDRPHERQFERDRDHRDRMHN